MKEAQSTLARTFGWCSQVLWAEKAALSWIKPLGHPDQYCFNSFRRSQQLTVRHITWHLRTFSRRSQGLKSGPRVWLARTCPCHWATAFPSLCAQTDRWGNMNGLWSILNMPLKCFLAGSLSLSLQNGSLLQRMDIKSCFLLIQVTSPDQYGLLRPAAALQVSPGSRLSRYFPPDNRFTWRCQ